MGTKKWHHEVRRVAEVLGAPFIGREMDRRGHEAGVKWRPVVLP
jgi:hypothetical protein